MKRSVAGQRLACLAGMWLVWAAAAWAAEGVSWPAEWTVFGPGDPVSFRQTPDPAKLLPGAALKTIPGELEINGKTFPARTVRPENGRVDLAKQAGVQRPYQVVYFLAPVRAEADTTVTIGAGAGGWMQWWLDGQPVYDTLRGGGNGGSKRISGSDHVFDLTLSRGDHVLAVTVVRGESYDPVFAVAGPDEWAAQPSAFQTLMAAGRNQYEYGHWSHAINYPVAQGLFRRARAAATTDSEKAEAGVAMAEARLLDFIRETDLASIRGDFEAVLALGGAGERERARALLGIGETLLREKQYDVAREWFAKACGQWSDLAFAAEAQFAVARAYVQQRRYEEAQRELDRYLAMEGVDPELGQGCVARALQEGIRLAPQVRREWPRLFFNGESWPAIKARALGPERARLDALRAEAQALAPEPGQACNYGRPLMDAALVYRVTGDPALLDTARRLARATLDYYLTRSDYNAHIYSRMSAVAGLDWLWNDLPADERAALARDLLHYVYWFYQDLTIKLGKKLPRVGGSYYEDNIVFYTGLTLLDPALDDVEYARALLLLGQGFAGSQRDLEQKLRNAKDDGGIDTSLDYVFCETCNRFWPFLYCWQSALSGGVEPRMAYLLSPDFVLRSVFGIVPGQVRHFGYARAWRSSGGLMHADELYDHLNHYIHLFGKTHPQEARMAAYLRRQMKPERKEATGEYSIYPFLVNPEGEPEPAIPDGIPIARHFEGLGQVLMSSGFRDADTYALFACGGNELCEVDYDATHFAIYKQGYLALDSGTRAQTQPSAVPGNNYTHQTVAHNCVLIHMPGEVLLDLGNKPIQSNSGGQRYRPYVARPLAFETDASLFAYMATDATPTYHTNKCAQMVRQFVFLPPDHFVVFDRVTSKRADFPKTWLLHTANEPAIAGKEFRADQDQGRIFCRTLLPADAVLEPVGGPGKEFWADGKNWPIPEDSPFLRNIGMTNGVVPENMGRWRVEVKPGSPREEDWFLHLIQTTDQTVDAMTPSELNDTGEQLEVRFAAGARSYTITLNKRGEVGGHIRIAEGSQVLADRPLTRAVQPQAGLALGKESENRSQ